MNSIFIFFSIVSIIFPILCFVVTNNIISSAIVLLATCLYLFAFAYPKIKQIAETNKRFHSCYSFINSYIVSISVQGSLLAAFEATKITMDKDYIEIIEGISNLKEEERLDYLKKYYDFDIYYLFLSVMNVYIEQGGDIFKIAHFLIDESRRKEDYLIKSENITKRKIIELSSLWLFTLLIIFVLRFSLNSFYSIITRNLLFQISIVGVFLLLLLSLHLFLTKIMNNTFKGYGNV